MAAYKKYKYNLTQDQARSLGAPLCPKCGNLVDCISELEFFQYNVRVVACSECCIMNVEGSDDPWLPRLSEYRKPMEERARMIHEANMAKASR